MIGQLCIFMNKASHAIGRRMIDAYSWVTNNCFICDARQLVLDVICRRCVNFLFVFNGQFFWRWTITTYFLTGVVSPVPYSAELLLIQLFWVKYDFVNSARQILNSWAIVAILQLLLSQVCTPIRFYVAFLLDFVQGRSIDCGFLFYFAKQLP